MPSRPSSMPLSRSFRLALPADPSRGRTARRGDALKQRREAGLGWWHHRMIQFLLYGRGVDRARKAQARVGLALIGFALVYAIIALRLVLYAVVADTHMVRRGGTTDAVATARPNIVDRNGEILATDFRTPSLFA